MSNTLLTPTAVTREALRIFHQEATFLTKVNRQYDSSFGKSGAKIGDSLKIRLPNQYTVRSGINMASQATTESSVTLQVATVKGVDMEFTSEELALSLDDFSERVIRPAVSVLASAIEYDVLSNVMKDIYQVVKNTGAAIDLDIVQSGRKQMQDALVPSNDRYALLSTHDNLKLVNALKGYYNPSGTVSQQFKSGVMAQALGFDFMESTHLGNQTRGAGDANYLTNQVAPQTGASLIVDTGTGTLYKGETFTIDGVYSVHPETKVSTGVLQKFVVTADYAGGAGTVSISPAIVASGPYQNVSNGAANNKAITITGTASTNYGQSLLFQKDAFAFVTADLPMPKGVDFAAREVMDGISISLVRDFSVSDRSFPTRLDVLYGYKTIRPEAAVRMLNQAAS